MPKPDAALLNPARYPYTCRIETRFSDLDTNVHINNVALMDILQEARVRFHHAGGFSAALENRSAMVASLAIEYLGQAYFPEAVTAHVAASYLGRTSYGLTILLSQQGQIVAYAQVILVCTDTDGPAELPAAYRDGLQSFMLQP